MDSTLKEKKLYVNLVDEDIWRSQFLAVKDVYEYDTNGQFLENNTFNYDINGI